MPPRYHYSINERISPIWVVPKLGYALTSKEMGEEGMSIGVSCLFQSVRRSYLCYKEPWLRQRGTFYGSDIRCPWSLLAWCQAILN